MKSERQAGTGPDRLWISSLLLLLRSGAVRLPPPPDEDIPLVPVANEYNCQGCGRSRIMRTHWQCRMWDWARTGRIGLDLLRLRGTKAGAENVCARRRADSVCGNIQVVSFLLRTFFSLFSARLLCRVGMAGWKSVRICKMSRCLF